MKAGWIGVLLAALCVAGNVDAGGGRAAVRKQAEMSLVATGHIVIDGEGSVESYTLDRPDQLPPVVARLLDRAVALWRFEPVRVDGKPVRAKTAMSVRVATTRNEDGTYGARIVGADFQTGYDPEEWVAQVKKYRPRYPDAAARAGMGGIVYVVLRIGRDGKVHDAVVEQVNLRAVDTERAMPQWRELLARSALEAARRWTFRPPTRGEEMDRPFWSARVPVDYLMAGTRQPEYGQWEVYIPGPHQPAPWSEREDAALGADAIAGDGLFRVGGGPRLLTPPGGA